MADASVELRQRLIQAGAERAAARRHALELSDEIAQLAREAIAAGIPKREIARLAQVSRPALDAMLEDEQE
jgi:hypothetical protein